MSSIINLNELDDLSEEQAKEIVSFLIKKFSNQIPNHYHPTYSTPLPQSFQQFVLEILSKNHFRN